MTVSLFAGIFFLASGLGFYAWGRVIIDGQLAAKGWIIPGFDKTLTGRTLRRTVEDPAFHAAVLKGRIISALGALIALSSVWFFLWAALQAIGH